MFLKMNIKGENALDLSANAIRKMPGKLYVSNERHIDELKDKYLKKDNTVIYRQEEGYLLKEKGSLESQLVYTKAEQNEVEFIFYTITDALSYSLNSGHYINLQEYTAGSTFASQLISSLRNMFNYAGEEEYDIAVTVSPLYLNIYREKLVPYWEGAGFKITPTALTEASDIPLMKEYFSKVYIIDASMKSTVADFMKRLYIMLVACNNEQQSYLTADNKARIIAYTDTWIKNHPYGAEILDKVFGKARDLFDSAKEELNIGSKEELPGTNNAGFGDEEGTCLHEVVADTVLKEIDLKDNMNIVDYGCNGGEFLMKIAMHAYEQNIKDVRTVGIDSFVNVVERAQAKVAKLKKIYPDIVVPKIIQGSLLYTDSRVAKADVAVLMEVIEHNSLDKLESLLDNVFYQDPYKVIITTPNRDYNSNFFTEEKPFTNAMGYRHWDHRFEFNKQEFEDFLTNYIDSNMYTLTFKMIGREIDNCKPTCMAVITRKLWHKPTQYNTDYNEIENYNKALSTYNSNLMAYNAYKANPELYLREMKLKLQKSREPQNQNKQHLNSTSPTAGIDPMFIGDLYEIVCKGKPNKQEQHANSKPYDTVIPKEPVKPYIIDIIKGQIGSAFKLPKVNKETGIDKFIRLKCKREEDKKRALEIYKDCKGDMKEFYSLYWEDYKKRLDSTK